MRRRLSGTFKANILSKLAQFFDSQAGATFDICVLVSCAQGDTVLSLGFDSAQADFDDSFFANFRFGAYFDTQV